MKSCIIVFFLFISSFQLSKSNPRPGLIFEEQSEQFQSIDSISNNKENFILNSQETGNYRTEVDPNDRISVELWNQLNEEDIKNMSTIDDYSNETTARQWLAWYVRIVERYNQVNFKKDHRIYLIV